MLPASKWIFLAGLLVAGIAQGGEAMQSGLVPPYPEGLEETSGFCISEPSSSDTCPQSIAYLGQSQQRPFWIVAQRFHDYVGKKARWTITDRMPYPKLPEDELLLVAVCEREGKLDTRIMAIVADEGDVEWFSRVSSAWQVDGDGRFVEVSTSGIRCMNDGWGL